MIVNIEMTRVLLRGTDVAEKLFELLVLPPEPLVLLLELADAGHLGQQQLGLLLGQQNYVNSAVSSPDTHQQ
jgi:hypothetical protein